MENRYNDMNLFDFIALCCRKLKSFFLWLLNILRYLIALCWKRWYIIAVGVILGFVFARFWIKPRFTHFTGEATIVFPEGMKQTIIEGLACFDNESGENKKDMFGIPYNIQKKFRGMTYFNSIDAKCDSTIDYVDFDREVKAGDSASTVVGNRLTIQIKLIGAEGFWNYEQALCLYFNQREEYTKPAKRWRESMQRRIALLDEEIARTDSFIDYDYFHQRNTVIVTDSIKLGHPAEMRYNDLLHLQREREYLAEQLAMTPDVVNFQTHFHATALLIRDKYIYSVIGGFVLALLVSLIIEYRKQINKYLHPNKQ